MIHLFVLEEEVVSHQMPVPLVMLVLEVQCVNFQFALVNYPMTPRKSVLDVDLVLHPMSVPHVILDGLGLHVKMQFVMVTLQMTQ